MRTSAKRLSLVRTVELETELVELLALVELELYRAGAELDRWHAELMEEVYADILRPKPERIPERNTAVTNAR